MANSITDFKRRVHERVKCCACDGSLGTSKHINLVATTKVATWKFPIAQSLLIENAPPNALAMLCDQCIENKVEAKYAVEADPGYSDVVYHELSSLEDEPEELKMARASFPRPSPHMN